MFTHIAFRALALLPALGFTMAANADDFVPCYSRLAVHPETVTISAGDTIVLNTVLWRLDEYGRVFQDTIFHELIVWSADGPPNNPGLANAVGSTASFHAAEAYGTCTITARFVNPDDTMNTVVDSAVITVVPGPPSIISIEAGLCPQTTISCLRDANPQGLVTMTSAMTDASVYAVHRDRYGKYVGPVISPTWQGLDLGVVTVRNGTLEQGEGIVQRETIDDATTKVIASKDELLADTVSVTVDGIAFTQLRVCLSTPDTIVQQLTVAVGDTAWLIAQGRTVLGTWVHLPVVWDTAGVRVSSVPRGPDSVWAFVGAEQGYGTVTISAGEIIHSIPVTVEEPPTSVSRTAEPARPEPGQSVPEQGCGNGVGLALIPAVGLGVLSRRRRRRKAAFGVGPGFRPCRRRDISFPKPQDPIPTVTVRQGQDL